MNDTTDIVPLEAHGMLPATIIRDAEAVYTRAINLRIATAEDYQEAASIAADIAESAKSLDKDREELKADFLKGCRKIDDYFRGPIARRKEAVQKIKDAMIAYDKRQAEIRRLAQEQEDRERREREAAAKKLQDEAEAKLKAEQEAAQEAERAKAAGDREAAIEATRRQLRAEEAAKTTVAAAQEAAKAVEAPRPWVSPTPLKVAGVARKTVWKWRLKNPGKDLQSMLEDNLIPLKYLMLDEEKIQRAVDRLKDMAQETLGDWIEVYDEAALAIGKGRGK